MLQHMGSYHTTENTCVIKMRVTHKTKSCECIIIHQDRLYIASSTLQRNFSHCKGKIQNQDQSK